MKQEQEQQVAEEQTGYDAVPEPVVLLQVTLSEGPLEGLHVTVELEGSSVGSMADADDSLTVDTIRRQVAKAVSDQLGNLASGASERLLAELKARKSRRQEVGPWAVARKQRKTKILDPDLLETLGVDPETIKACTIPVKTELSKEALVARDVDPKMIKAATREVPGAEYVEVREIQPSKSRKRKQE